jgi:alanine racemase
MLSGMLTGVLWTIRAPLHPLPRDALMSTMSGEPLPEPHETGRSRQRAWVEVDSGAIRANASTLKRFIGARTDLMAVVKADGYGHGAVPVARAALAGGAGSFGVATLAEGVQLRRAGITAPVLVLGNLTQPEELRSCLRWQLMPTISSMREALLCHNLASGSGRTMALQLKLDTGMTRLGVDWQEGARMVRALGELEAIQLAGTYSHLACADAPPGEDDGLTGLQSERFEAVLTSLADQGLAGGCRHLANSAGTLRSHGLHYDRVRVGLALYGLAPAPHQADVLPLRTAMQVRARITLIRPVAAGVGVSYGHRFTTRRPSRLAVVAIGYADGVPRRLSNRMEVLFRGQRLPQVGTITMDQMVIDATDCPALDVGSVVTLLGRQEGETISATDWSDRCETIPWEILCGFKHRLPRLPGGATES